MNKDAIDRKLVCAFIAGLISDDGERRKGLEYIRNMPPVNPQPCEDAISREDALMALTGEWTEITDEIIHRFIKRIKALPPVNPQPKTGQWIPQEMETYIDGKLKHWKAYKCNKCDNLLTDDYEYCPHCGARMVEPQERSGEE